MGISVPAGLPSWVSKIARQIEGQFLSTNPQSPVQIAPFTSDSQPPATSAGSIIAVPDRGTLAIANSGVWTELARADLSNVDPSKLGSSNSVAFANTAATATVANYAQVASTANSATAALTANTANSANIAGKLANARVLSFSGAATGSLSFDGSANASAALTLSAGQAVANLGYTPLSSTGTAVAASKLATARTLTLTGAATGSLSFDGTANVSAALTLAAGQAVANLGYTPLNRGGDAMTGPLSVGSIFSVSAAVGSAPSSTDAGQIASVTNPSLSGETRVFATGTTAAGKPFLRTPAGDMQLIAGNNTALVLPSLSNTALLYGQPICTTWTGSGSDGAPHQIQIGWNGSNPIISIDGGNGIFTVPTTVSSGGSSSSSWNGGTVTNQTTFDAGVTLAGQGKFLTLDVNQNGNAVSISQGLANNFNLGIGIQQGSTATATSGVNLQLPIAGGLTLTKFSGATIGQTTALTTLLSVDASGNVTVPGYLTVNGGSNISGGSGGSWNGGTVTAATAFNAGVAANDGLSVAAPVGAAPSSYDAGQIVSVSNPNLSGETRVLTAGTAPNGMSYIRAPNAPLQIVAGATLAATLDGTGSLTVPTAISSPKVSTGLLNYIPQLTYNGSSYTSTSIDAGYRQAVRQMDNTWWDSNQNQNTVNMPRVRPSSGAVWGEANNSDQTVGNFWQMAQYTNFMYWHWKMTGSEVMKAKIQSQWNFILWVYDPSRMPSTASYQNGTTVSCHYGVNWGLGSNGTADGTINASDDAAWKLLYLMQVHDCLGDQRAINYIETALPQILNFFADPNRAQVQNNGLNFSPNGLLYQTSVNNTNPIYNATSYEIGLMLVALYVYEVCDYPNWLYYPQYAANNWLTQQMKSGSGTYSNGVSLSTLKSSNFGYNKAGSTAFSFSGTLFAGILFAKLYKLTGQSQYLTEANSCAAALCKPQDGGQPDNSTSVYDSNGNFTAFASTWGFVSTSTVTSGVFLPFSDPYTDGFPSAWFVAEALTLSGVDPQGICRNYFSATGSSIINQYNANQQRSSNPFSGYTSDWGGALLSTTDSNNQGLNRSGTSVAGLFAGYTSFQDQFDHGQNPYSGYQQLMTEGSTVSMLQSAFLIDQMQRGVFGNRVFH